MRRRFRIFAMSALTLLTLASAAGWACSYLKPEHIRLHAVLQDDSDGVRLRVRRIGHAGGSLTYTSFLYTEQPREPREIQGLEAAYYRDPLPRRLPYVNRLGFGFVDMSWGPSIPSPNIMQRGSTFAIPYWLLTLAFAAAPAVALLVRVRRRLQIPAGHCRQCGYDLRATPGRCPECGTSVIPE